MNDLLRKHLMEMAQGGAQMPPAWEQGASAAQPEREAPPMNGIDLMAYFKAMRPEMFSQDAIQTAQDEDAETNQNREMGRSFARATGYFTRQGPDYTGLGPTDQAVKGLGQRQDQAFRSADVGSKVAQFGQAQRQSQETNDPQSATSRMHYRIWMQDPVVGPQLQGIGPAGTVSKAQIDQIVGARKEGVGMGETVGKTKASEASATKSLEDAATEASLRGGKVEGQGYTNKDLALKPQLTQSQIDKNRADIEAGRATAQTANAEKIGKTEQDLRKEFQGTPMFTQANEVNTAYRKVLAAPPTPKGDLALVYSYVKILDPGSVVREGEIQLSKEGRSYETQVKAWVSKAKTGEGFTPEERADFRAGAKAAYTSQMQSYTSAAENYKRMATERGANPANVVLDMGIGGDGAAAGGNADPLGVR